MNYHCIQAADDVAVAAAETMSFSSSDADDSAVIDDADDKRSSCLQVLQIMCLHY